MTAQPTPGPWLVSPFVARVDNPKDNLPICALLWPTDERSEEETEANARLIAAAPDLLEAARDAEWALEGLVEAEDLGDECPRVDSFELCGASCCEQSGCAVDRLARVRAAIAKATAA